MILRAQPIGTPPCRRYIIENLHDNTVFDGQNFVENWDEARKYATASDACADMQHILRKHYEHLPRHRYVCPVEIEVYGDTTLTKLARYLHLASVLNVKTHEHGNGPKNCLVMPTIHFGLIKEIRDNPLMANLNDQDESEEWQSLLEEYEKDE